MLASDALVHCCSRPGEPKACRIGIGMLQPMLQVMLQPIAFDTRDGDGGGGGDVAGGERGGGERPAAAQRAAATLRLQAAVLAHARRGRHVHAHLRVRHL